MKKEDLRKLFKEETGVDYAELVHSNDAAIPHGRILYGEWLEKKYIESLTTEQVSDSFLSACDEARRQFAEYVSLNFDVGKYNRLRTEIDTLIVMYDQMRDKLTNTKER